MKPWELIATDDVSGRQIFKQDVEPVRGSKTSTYGGYDFKTAADFEVRDADGTVLLSTYGSAHGEHWCGVFLWFVEGSNGTRVRLEESDAETHPILDVPDRPKSS